MPEPFKASKELNNLKSNYFTIVSLSNIEKYVLTMDGNQPIELFEMGDCFWALLHLILKYFKNVKKYDIATYHDYHGWVPFPDDYIRFNTNKPQLQLPEGLSEDEQKTFLLETITEKSRFKKKLVYSFWYIDLLKLADMFLNISDLNLHWRYRWELTNCKFQLPLKKLHLDGAEEIGLLHERFNSLNLQSLTLCFSNFSNCLPLGKLDEYFPKLIFLTIVSYSSTLTEDLARLQSRSHQNLKTLLIHGPDPTLLKKKLVGGLIFSFPRASISWWDGLTLGSCGEYTLDLLNVMTPCLCYGRIGYHMVWTLRDTPDAELVSFAGFGTEFEVYLELIYSKNQLIELYRIVREVGRAILETGSWKNINEENADEGRLRERVTQTVIQATDETRLVMGDDAEGRHTRNKSGKFLLFFKGMFRSSGRT